MQRAFDTEAESLLARQRALRAGAARAGAGAGGGDGPAPGGNAGGGGGGASESERALCAAGLAPAPRGQPEAAEEALGAGARGREDSAPAAWILRPKPDGLRPKPDGRPGVAQSCGPASGGDTGSAGRQTRAAGAQPPHPDEAGRFDRGQGPAAVGAARADCPHRALAAARFQAAALVRARAVVPARCSEGGGSGSEGGRAARGAIAVQLVRKEGRDVSS